MQYKSENIEEKNKSSSFHSKTQLSNAISRGGEKLEPAVMRCLSCLLVFVEYYRMLSVASNDPCDPP